MAIEKDDEIETIENTEVGEKAKEIGKELGVEKDIPDYDIQEEPDDQEDERIAKEREQKTDKKDRKVLTNKEKREIRKKRLSEKFGEKDAEIQRLSEENQQMRQWKSEVDNRLSGINKTEVEKAFNETVTAFAQAEKDHADAFAEGDGVKATKAMRVMYDAQRRIEQLQGVKQQLEKQPMQAQAQAQAPQQVDREVVNKAQAWASRNAWYKANGNDVDSEIAKAISGVLANEGYDPKSDDFWDELDDRLEDRMPEKLGERHEEEDVVEQKARKRASPPVGGGANRSDVKGKKTITLPTSYINTLKANGIWDDVPRRNKIIAERERILRESGQ